jgi:hypothetical protein
LEGKGAIVSKERLVLLADPGGAAMAKPDKDASVFGHIEAS